MASRICSYCGRAFNRYVGIYECAPKHKDGTYSDIIVRRILDSLECRKGFGHWINNLDDDILDEIEDDLKEIVEEEVESYIKDNIW